MYGFICRWDVGTTEEGSSGSPLFEDQNRRVFGVESYMNTEENYCDSGTHTYYTSINRMWDVSTDPDTCLETFLGGGTNEDYTNTVSIPYVSGDNYVCWNSPKFYYLNNKPSGSTITWTVSSNLQKLYSYSNYVVVMPKYSSSYGEGFVRAGIRTGSSCNWGYFQKDDIWVGKPNSSGESLIGGYQIFYPSPFPCIYTYGIYYGLTLSGRIEGTSSDANYVWSGLYAYLTKLAWNGAKFVPNYPGSPYYGSGYVQVTGANECGTSMPVQAGYGPCG